MGTNGARPEEVGKERERERERERDHKTPESIADDY